MAPADQTPLAELRAAARALLAELDDPRGDLAYLCDQCPRCATWSLVALGRSTYSCDLHRPAWGSPREQSYAPALRKLREMTKED